MSNVEPAPLAEIRVQLRAWNRAAKRLRYLSVGLGLTAIVASVLVASDLLPDRPIRVLAVVAAVATTALTGLDLTHKSNGFRNAWRMLNAELMRHESGIEPDERKAVSELIDAYERAERLIGDISIRT